MTAQDRLIQDRLIVALDFAGRDSALRLVDLLGDAVLWYKVGLQLFLAEGRSIIDELLARQKRVFLDLKLHDIPNTVAGAVGVVMQTGASLLTVHASGGSAMLRAAADAAGLPDSPKLLAVTVLTSMHEKELEETGVSDSTERQVLRLAGLAVAAGFPGLVCSPHEIASLRKQFGPEPLLVVPGIRSNTDRRDDQQRVLSASEAIRLGASMLVVGRPITTADDPRRVATTLLGEIEIAIAAQPV